MMLYLVGMGISDERDLPMKALDILLKCNEVYCEMFTSIWHGNLHVLEKMIQKRITVISREDAESAMLVKRGKEMDVALLVPGDPLTATTHVELMLESHKQGVPFDVIHASSIYTAVAETGLQIYKFGRTTTLPKPQGNFKPTSPLEIIKENDKQGLHTLILLDIGMTATEGLQVLSENGYDKHRVVACCRLGSSEKTIKYGNVGQLLDEKSIAKAPAVIILPGKIHFKEEEALQLWM